MSMFDIANVFGENAVRKATGKNEIQGPGLTEWLFGPNSLIGQTTGYLSGTTAQNAAAKQAADDQMKFQERMSSSAHQREIEDLKKAGLNPVLSGTGGSGESSPGGASYSPQASNSFNSLSSLMSMLSVIAGLSQTGANTELAKAQTAAVYANTSKARAVQPIYDSGGEIIKIILNKIKETFSNSGKKKFEFPNLFDEAKKFAGKLKSKDVSGGSW